MNEWNDLMPNKETPMPGLLSKALKTIRSKLTNKEYLEIESNICQLYEC